MDNPRPEKVAVVEEVKTRLTGSGAALLTEYRGLDVTAMAQLRRSLRAAGGDYKIYKNTLVRFAARDLGLEIEELLVGPTAIAFVETDPVTVAKALRDFARTNPALVLKGGLLGTTPLSADEARRLADVPPREQLLAMLAGAIAAPLQQFAGLLQALPRDFAFGLKALIEQQGGAPASAEVEAPAEAPPAPETAETTEPEPAETAQTPETPTDSAEAPAAATDTDTAQES